MGKFNRVILGCVLFCACSSDSAPMERSQARAPVPRAKAALPEPAPDPRLDAQGNLKPGDEKMSWLEIPMGFTRRAGSTDRDAAFEADGLTIAHLRNYVNARATPTSVDYRRNGEAYLAARPNHSQLLTPLNITVLEVDRDKHRIRFLVEDRSPTGPVLTPAQAADALAKARTHME